MDNWYSVPIEWKLFPYPFHLSVSLSLPHAAIASPCARTVAAATTP